MTPKVFEDERGFFMETFRADCFRSRVGDWFFVQDNYSRSTKGTLRGLHYQINCPQGKLVSVMQGEVFDVAVDLRRGSSYFGRWVGVTLSAESKQMLWIPPGFAHGFYVLSEQAEFSYKCSDYYAPEYERSIIWNDPDIGIDWPIPPGGELLLSEKDKAGVSFNAAEVFA